MSLLLAVNSISWKTYYKNIIDPVIWLCVWVATEKLGKSRKFNFHFDFLRNDNAREHLFLWYYKLEIYLTSHYSVLGIFCKLKPAFSSCFNLKWPFISKYCQKLLANLDLSNCGQKLTVCNRVTFKAAQAKRTYFFQLKLVLQFNLVPLNKREKRWLFQQLRSIILISKNLQPNKSNLKMLVLENWAPSKLSQFWYSSYDPVDTAVESR